MKQIRGRTGARRDLEDIIQTCNSIESRRFNPFLLDVSEALDILRRHAEHLGSLEDHLLDMRALTGIARVVGLQSAQLRFQSSSLFVDPEMAKQKLDGLSRQQLAEFLLLSWHPIIELEQLTPSTVKEATEYWNQMLSFYERRKRLQLGPFTMPEAAGLAELTSAGLVEEKAFSKKLQEVWSELKQTAGPDGTVEYWVFVAMSTFRETVKRAQIVSFLVSYGFASLEQKRGNLFLIPKQQPQPPKQGSPLSFPIPIPKEVPFQRAK